VQNDNLLCNKCGKKGHISKDSAEEIECVNCGKGYQSMRCVWLKHKKPTANLVGFEGPGLYCFVAEHAKENSGAEEKGKAIAIVKVQEVYF
jgi:Zn ribbon nucleic-acid-binding protein